LLEGGWPAGWLDKNVENVEVMIDVRLYESRLYAPGTRWIIKEEPTNTPI
jgi:hypothetical protein